MLAAKLLAGMGEAPLYADDVFSAFTRNGTGASASIVNGLPLSTKGGLTITKARSAATGWRFTDTVRGVTKSLDSSTTAAQATDATGLTAFNSNGYTVGADANYNNSTGPVTYVDYSFVKAPKFFDVVTWTGDGTSIGRQIPHSLGVQPGMVYVKCTSNSGQSGCVWHRGLTSGSYIIMESTAAQTTTAATSVFGNGSTTVDPTASVFTVGGSSATNGNTFTYVAYLFAHDTSTDGLIQCGSFTSTAGGNISAPVNLGWEPQFVLWKVSSGGTSNWWTSDSMRGMTANSSGNDSWLYPNLSSAEATEAGGIYPTPTGFTIPNGLLDASRTYIYLAIRRPNKPPTTGTQVFNSNTGTLSTGTVRTVGFAADLIVGKARTTTDGINWNDRLRGFLSGNTSTSLGLDSSSTSAESAGQLPLAYDVWNTTAKDGGYMGAGASRLWWYFRRAPGVMDQICFSGSGANKTEAHGLGVTPELWLVKGRSGATQWVWGSSLLAATEKIVMPTPAGKVTDATAWNSTYPTASVLSLGTAAAVNTSAATYVGYLWATKAGVSKVFAYTGNGSSQNIDCGFSTGARFILIVRTSAAGSVYIWDTVRGVVAGNDPFLALDTTAAEVTTDDSVDPLASGFSVNQLAATNINVNGATYIGLAYS